MEIYPYSRKMLLFQRLYIYYAVIYERLPKMDVA